MTEPKEQSQQAYFGSGAPLQTSGYIHAQPSVCPTCGTCPTCKQRVNNNSNGYWYNGVFYYPNNGQSFQPIK